MSHDENSPGHASPVRDLGDGVEDHLIPLKPLDPLDAGSFDDLVRAMGKTAFGGRSVGEAADVLTEMANDKDCLIVATFSGAMTVAKMGTVIIRMMEAGLIHAFWSVDTLDWQIKTIDGIVENTMKQVRAVWASNRNRGMILFHDVHQRTVGLRDPRGQWIDGASLRVIDALTASGREVRFVTLPEIVDELNSRR